MKNIYLLLGLLLIIHLGYSQNRQERKSIKQHKTSGAKAFYIKDYGSAFRHFEKSLEISRKYYVDTAVVYNAALAAYNDGKYKEAIFYFRKCIKYDYKGPNSYLMIAKIMKTRGDTERYINILKEGMLKYPNELDILYSVTNYYLRKNKISESIYYLDKAIEKNPDNAQLYFAKGNIYDRTGDFENAKYYYDMALMKNPDMYNAYFNLGVLFFNQAVDLYQEAKAIPEEDKDNRKAAMELVHEELKKALPYLEKAYLIDPKKKEKLVSTLKGIYKRLKDEDKAYKNCYVEIKKKTEGKPNYYTPYRPYNPSLDRNKQLTIKGREDSKFKNQKLTNQANTGTAQNATNNNERKNNSTKEATVKRSFVDTDIPDTNFNNENTFALIIGNEDYKHEIKVDHAVNDAIIFSKYVTKTLGVPESNVRVLKNATLGKIYTQLKWISEIQRVYGEDASVIFYYAGHGMPDEKTKDAYLLPVDGMSEMPLTAIKLDWFYKQITLYPSKKVTVFLDACFSGGARDGMLAKGRGVKIKPRNNKLKNNIIVFSATSDSQTAYPYKEKQHGLFTYYLLKKLNETKGNITLGELYEYVNTQVEKKAIVVKNRPQTPTVKTSMDFRNRWKNIKMAE
jgi:tetratricopeptide (TPR) repeat protein